ncbi:MAG: glycosyl hydrolase 115 family protein [Verrucomicrobiota bacterium]
MRRTMQLKFTLILVATLCLADSALALTTNSFVSAKRSSDSFPIVAKGKAASIFVDVSDWPGVVRVAKDLQTDIGRVSGASAALTHDTATLGKQTILVGTIGRSAMIDRLVREKKIDVSDVAGKWEATLIQVVKQPLPGVESALVIAGSDKRGTIYGVYEVSEQMGVSPWHWFADVPPKQHKQLFVSAGRHVLAPSAVKYRGIFINDEGPALMTWARKKYGELNHGMYTNVFELILRCQGNYLWPAMWDNSFATDDPLNAKLADEYGVVISTSHHEPMMRAWQEWKRAGNGPHTWDYAKNDVKLREFWAEGLRRTKDYEKVITLGMRGDGDEPMSETESVALLERIVADQRKMIGEIINPNVEQVPQVWALYKEVQGYYERGMRAPDDVILLWCDDNWGNIRRLPTAEERKRSGGAGVYYHFDYVGGPRNYKWINTVPLPKIWEQMNLAWHYGATNLWIVNVGDIKPEEVPLEFFLALGRNPAAWNKDNLDEYLRRWAEREFGTKHAAAIADIVAKYAKYNGRRKPELLDPGTFSLDNYGEADRALAEWLDITKRAEKIYAKLPKESRDAFYQLVLYPTKGSAVVNELYIAVAKNRTYAKQNDPRANDFAKRARELFAEDQAMSDYYNNTLAGGKWKHMMDQTRIGYTSWQQPNKNVMPKVEEVAVAPERRAPAQPVVKPKSKRAEAVLGVPKSWHGFIEQNGYVSIEAEHFTRKTDTGNARWEVLPDHGRTLSAMTIFPITAPSVAPPQNSPALEYQMWLTSTGAVEVTTILSPVLNFAPDRGVRIAVSFDDEAPQIITIVPKGYTAGDSNRDWEESVKNNARKVKSKHTIAAPGAHVFKVWMVDPAVVVQKIVVDCGGVMPSYLGPPESPRQ